MAKKKGRGKKADKFSYLDMMDHTNNAAARGIGRAASGFWRNATFHPESTVRQGAEGIRDRHLEARDRLRQMAEQFHDRVRRSDDIARPRRDQNTFFGRPVENKPDPRPDPEPDTSKQSDVPEATSPEAQASPPAKSEAQPSMNPEGATS